MYFIGLFYKGEKEDSTTIKIMMANYSFRDVLTILWSNLIMITFSTVMIYIMKMKLINPNMPRELFVANVNFNFKKSVAIFSIFAGLLTYFFWSISVFAMNLDGFVSYKWIFNTSISILIEITLTPFIKGIIFVVIVGWLKKKMKEINEKNKMKVAKVSSFDGEIDIHSGAESND